MRLKFIKPWGTYKVGDIHITESPTTQHYLIDVHRVAIDAGPDRSAEPIIVVAQPTAQVTGEAKFLRGPKHDKMLRGPRKAKAETHAPEAGDGD